LPWITIDLSSFNFGVLRLFGSSVISTSYIGKRQLQIKS
jgi:hypothetical protein